MTRDRVGALGRVAALAMLVATLAPAPVAAHDHAPPQTAVVSSSGRVVEGRLGSFCWSTGAVIVTGECARGAAVFPRFAGRGFVARTLRIHKSAPPDSLLVYRWTDLDRGREPVGRRRAVSIEGMWPVVTGSGVAWDYTLALPADEASYLLVYGQWRDSEGCVICPDQQARWLFSIPGRGEGG